MKKRTTLVRLCAAILVVAALAAFSVPAMAADAASIQEQMAQNSAAWHIANNAGDVATCQRLHEENERLGALLAQGGGTAVYSENGTWTITDADGSVTSSAKAGLSGKDPGVVYTTAGSDGSISAERDRAYTDTSIDAYMNNGGTHSGLSESYNITASAGTGGTISPSGSKTVAYGGSQAYTITPSTGYDIYDVKVDGKSVGAVRTYVFSNVTAGHTISASFRPDPVVDMGSLTVTDTLGASLSGKSIKSGYGICVSVPVTLENVTDVSVTLSYNFGSGCKTVTMKESGSKFVLPVNPDSPTGARCVYIPVDTKDGSYTLTAAVSALDADGNTVTDSATGTVTVLGSMYEDDFTGDS